MTAQQAQYKFKPQNTPAQRFKQLRGAQLALPETALGAAKKLLDTMLQDWLMR